MDAGVSKTCLSHNAAALEVDLSKVESVVLSHGHFDHFGALVEFLNSATRGMPLILHPEAFLQRRLPIITQAHKNLKLGSLNAFHLCMVL